MSWQAPNLAHHPFENLRPVRRTALVFWLAAVGLTGWNVTTWYAAGAGAKEKTAELARLQRETREASARVDTLEHDLAGADLEAENKRTAFLNARIAERVFSWNLLLDRLVETLPEGVRLRQLSPDAGRRDARATQGIETVALSISGEAQDDDALLEFIDRLFADPRFGRPDLARQATRDDGIVQFELAVEYQPGSEKSPPQPPAGAVAPHAAAPTTPPGDAAPTPSGAAAPRAEAAP
jgi:Tfp pilus assembly protein PilN